MQTERPTPFTARLAAVLLLILGATLTTWVAWVKSDTYDEPMYILSGYAYLSTGDFSINKEHPPLAKLLLGLPLLGLDLELPPYYQQRPGIPFAFLFHQPRVEPHTILFRARLPGVLLSVLLGLYVFRWAHLAFGWRAGLMALALCATSPPLVAHAAIAGNDFAMVVFCLATLYHAWRWLTTGARSSLALAGIMLGCAVGAKLTALMLLPVIGLAVLVAAVQQRRPSLLGHALLALVASGGVLWLLYLGEARSLEDARQHVRFRLADQPGRVFALEPMERGLEAVFGASTPIPLLSFLKAIDSNLAHNAQGHTTYLRGKLSQEGFPDFYLQSWLIKNPIGLTLLLMLGLLSLRRTRRGLVHELLLYGLPLLLFAFFSRARIQLGFTYILPVVPPLCVAASRVLGMRSDDDGPRLGRDEALAGALLVLAVAVGGFLWFDDKGSARLLPWLALALPAAYAVLMLRGWRRAGPTGVPCAAPVALLAGWAALSACAQQPNALNHFNEWVGGPSNGWRYSVVRDDWGQDIAALGRWMAENEVESIHYDKYSTGDPEAWGVRFTPTHGRRPQASQGWLAVHVNHLARKPRNYRWLKGALPDESVNDTILLYRLENLPAPRSRSDEDSPGDDLPAGGAPHEGDAFPFEGAPDVRPDPEEG